MIDRRRIVLCAATALALAFAAAIPAQQNGHQHERHDHDSSDLGEVHFAVSCDRELQADFDRAVALLHSFGYELARDAFHEVATRDPRCGMAWWGVAATYYHPLWAAPTPEELAAGGEAAAKAKTQGATTDRERGYIDAIAAFYRDAGSVDHVTRAKAYAAALEELSRRFPDESEARIFYALTLLGTAPASDPELSQQRRAGEILNAELERQPHHPGIVHYIIHSFDYPGLADLALLAARAYADIAPASPHAQHMPSHIFTRLGLWQDSIGSNLDSEASANSIAQKRNPGAASRDALHALDYLEYAYLQTGQLEQARQVVERTARATRLDEGDFAGGYALAAIPARYALERRDWKAAARLEPPAVSLPWDRFPYAQAITHFARAIGAARSADVAIARTAVGALGEIQKKLAAAPPPGPYDWAGQVEATRLAAAGWLAHAEKRSEEGIELLRQAAALQDRVGKHPVTPGELLPARELLADLLAELGRPAEAVAEYESTLKVQPNRRAALEGAAKAAESAGDAAKARALRAALTSLQSGAAPSA